MAAVLLLLGCSGRKQEAVQPVRHVILWTLNDSVEGRDSVVKSVCENFYTLKDKIPGIISMNAVFEGRLPSSNSDFMFDIVFESEEALKGFSQHPEHLKQASALKPFIKSRACFDVLLQKKRMLLPNKI